MIRPGEEGPEASLIPRTLRGARTTPWGLRKRHWPHKVIGKAEPRRLNVPETVFSKTILSNPVEKTVFERTVFAAVPMLFWKVYLRLRHEGKERTQHIA